MSWPERPRRRNELRPRRVQRDIVPRLHRPPPDPAGLRDGDPAITEAFRRILRAHVRSYFNRESQIHDVTQDALLELLDKVNAGAEPQQPVYWALNSANNAVRRELTRVRHRVIEYESQLHGKVEHGDPDWAALLDAREDLRRINALLSECDEAPLIAIAGAAEGRDHRELAEQLGVSPGAARMTLSRARAELSGRFSAQQKLEELIALAKRAGLLDSEQVS
jgi:RNA polymerase sigma factor (sigma-70 family)